MQGIFRKENTDKALKYGIYRHLPTYEKIIRNLVSFYNTKSTFFMMNNIFYDNISTFYLNEVFIRHCSRLKCFTSPQKWFHAIGV